MSDFQKLATIALVVIVIDAVVHWLWPHTPEEAQYHDIYVP